ncbi:MAG: hypothetical protein AAGF76_07865 [Pseudomonadota bacterium]
MSEPRGWAIAACLIALAALQIPVLTTGFTVSGDDVEALGVALQGPRAVLDEAMVVIARDGRLGGLTIFPLNALGAWLASDAMARTGMAIAYLGVPALVSLWLARVWAPAAGALAFVVWSALHPLGLPHLPPQAFPLQLTVVFLVILMALLLMGEGQGWRGRAAALLLVLGLVAHEYGFLFGAALIGGGWLSRLLRAEGSGHARLRALVASRATLLEGGVLTIAFACLAGFLALSSGDYDGVSGAGLAQPDRVALAALGHVVSSTTLPEWDLRLFDLSGPAWAAAVARGALAGIAVLLLLPRLQLAWPVAALGALYTLAALALMTVPIVSAEKQQRWCLDNGDCHYLDTRMAIFGVVVLILIGLSLLPRVFAARRLTHGVAAAVMAVLATGTGFENEWEAERRLAPLMRPWERATRLACFPELQPSEDLRLARAIDPWGQVASHPWIDVNGIWRRFVASVDQGRHCPADGPARAAMAAEVAGYLPILHLGDGDRIGAGTGGRFLAEGWRGIESWGVWSAEEEARLLVRPASTHGSNAGQGPAVLRLDLYPTPFPDGRRRAIAIRLGDEVVWEGTGEGSAGEGSMGVGSGGCCTARITLPEPLPPELDIVLVSPDRLDISAPQDAPWLIGIGLRGLALETAK